MRLCVCECEFSSPRKLFIENRDTIVITNIPFENKIVLEFAEGCAMRWQMQTNSKSLKEIPNPHAVNWCENWSEAGRRLLDECSSALLLIKL